MKRLNGNLTQGMVSILITISLFCNRPYLAFAQHFSSCPSRQEIQNFFDTSPGNSVKTKAWQEQYQNHWVSWQGSIYRIHNNSISNRLEIFIKVLPTSFLYDTILVVEGNFTLPNTISRGNRLCFQGRIFRGIDSLGLKDIYILAPSVSSLNAC